MGILSKLFTKAQPTFEEGDIFYCPYKGKYLIYKLLRHEVHIGTYHVLCYELFDRLPLEKDIPTFQVSCYTTPIASNGFTKPKLLAKSKVSDDDLYGYREYILETNHDAEIIRLAKAYYKEGHALTTIRLNDQAIAKYDLAIELIPTFFEAIDNRAFCLMNLARWKEAIAGFEASLRVNPQTTLAEFSIGECYLKMNMPQLAILQFEKALAIDPQHQLSMDFLVKARAMLSK